MHAFKTSFASIPPNPNFSAEDVNERQQDQVSVPEPLMATFRRASRHAQAAILLQIEGIVLDLTQPSAKDSQGIVSLLQYSHLHLTMSMYMTAQRPDAWLQLLLTLVSKYTWDWYSWLPIITATLAICKSLLLAAPTTLVAMIDQITPNLPSTIPAATEDERVLCQLLRALQPTLLSHHRNFIVPVAPSATLRGAPITGADLMPFLNDPAADTFEAVLKSLAKPQEQAAVANACIAVLGGQNAALVSRLEDVDYIAGLVDGCLITAASSNARLLREWEHVAKASVAPEHCASVVTAMGTLLHQALQRRLVTLQDITNMGTRNQNTSPPPSFQRALLYTAWLSSNDDLLRACYDAEAWLLLVLDLGLFAPCLLSDEALCSALSFSCRSIFCQLFADHTQTYVEYRRLAAWLHDSNKQRYKGSIRKVLLCTLAMTFPEDFADFNIADDNLDASTRSSIPAQLLTAATSRNIYLILTAQTLLPREAAADSSRWDNAVCELLTTGIDRNIMPTFCRYLSHQGVDIYPLVLQSVLSRCHADMEAGKPMTGFWRSEQLLALLNLGKEELRETKHQKEVLSQLDGILKLSTSDNDAFVYNARLCQAVLSHIPKSSSFTSNTFKNCMLTMIIWLETHHQLPELSSYITEIYFILMAMLESVQRPGSKISLNATSIAPVLEQSRSRWHLFKPLLPGVSYCPCYEIHTGQDQIRLAAKSTCIPGQAQPFPFEFKNLSASISQDASGSVLARFKNGVFSGMHAPHSNMS
eukprot:TRINITY_DN10942_c0_g1_i3.p1 TRINITY_DN10942_c0_g1~~TRINITY_DN10942_c0_g1_i3.p1  ORF type:complete len:891 (+),score=109.75 TRINITY_DN10942_c0_g1_i3:401-2674(+)